MVVVCQSNTSNPKFGGELHGTVGSLHCIQWARTKFSIPLFEGVESMNQFGFCIYLDIAILDVFDESCKTIYSMRIYAVNAV